MEKLIKLKKQNNDRNNNYEIIGGGTRMDSSEMESKKSKAQK